MNGKIGCLLVSIVWLVQMAQSNWQPTLATAFTVWQPYTALNRSAPAKLHYNKSLRFNIYTFSVTSADSGRVRELFVKAYRGQLLLTSFHIRVDGAVVGAEVADLDNDRFPELYVYSTSDGSGSFGRIYAWQFLPERKADITPANWQVSPVDGYMGHDSLWVERNSLCRRFPLYHSGDANAEPSGGYRLMRYKLQSAGSGFSLIVE